jgi:hypothetical protein
MLLSNPIVAFPMHSRNDFGSSSSYYALEDRNIIAMYTVLPADCLAAARAGALIANDPATLLMADFNATAADLARKAAEAQRRLDAVAPLRATLLAEPQASVAMVRSGEVVWQGIPTALCYSVPLSANVNPKSLTVYVGRQAAGTYYPAGLGPTGVLPLAAAGCVNISFSRGIPPGWYTLALDDPTSGGSFGATVSVETARAAVACAGLTKSVAFVSPTITWNMPPAIATVRDTVRVMNARGDVVYWFYTSCLCQTAPGAKPVPNGVWTFRLGRSPVLGGFTFRLFPDGGAVVAAVAPDWVPWARMGW